DFALAAETREISSPHPPAARRPQMGRSPSGERAILLGFGCLCTCAALPLSRLNRSFGDSGNLFPPPASRSSTANGALAFRGVDDSSSFRSLRHLRGFAAQST